MIGPNAKATHTLVALAGDFEAARAAIMVCVFAAFSFARVVVMTAMGVGMALAVALDATLVRVLLVPATMRLLGGLNWWGPRFFSRPDRR